LKNVLGLNWRCVAALPLPPQKTIEDQAATQAEFLQSRLEPTLAEARAGNGQVFFVDAAPCVRGALLCCVWSAVRLCRRGGSGRKRYRVLGAWKAVTRELVTSTTDATVTAETRCARLQQSAALGLQGPITLVLDNARSQQCALVMGLAKSLHIHLECLPSDSPNLHLIERLWKFVKKHVLYGRHDATFAEFRTAIDGCLDKIPDEHHEELRTLMTQKFQTFDPASFLAA
jgi:transposase